MGPLPIFVKTYDLIKWLLPHTINFPKSQRFLLAKRIDDAVLNFYEAILRRGKLARSAGEALQDADVELEKLRLYLRLAQELKLLSFEQYEHTARQVAEIGKLGCKGKRAGCVCEIRGSQNARSSRRVVEQQPEESARIKPEQQRSDESQQQYRFPLFPVIFQAKMRRLHGGAARAIENSKLLPGWKSI